MSPLQPGPGWPCPWGCHPLSPRRCRDPSVSLSPLPRGVTRLGTSSCHLARATSAATQSLPPLCPQQWQGHVPGALSPPGGQRGDTGGDRWRWGSDTAAAEGGPPGGHAGADAALGGRRRRRSRPGRVRGDRRGPAGADTSGRGHPAAGGSWSFSWSFMLGWAGAALLGSAGLFHLCAASKDPSPQSSEVGES
ncbi:lens fiber membrane intrinsic protein isoform X2 [Poecile atricapillus]|nr:lens fiber membrane intrinsic protein isoform X2 [Poecile atricapillus]